MAMPAVGEENFYFYPSKFFDCSNNPINIRQMNRRKTFNFTQEPQSDEALSQSGSWGSSAMLSKAEGDMRFKLQRAAG